MFNVIIDAVQSGKLTDVSEHTASIITVDVAHEIGEVDTGRGWVGQGSVRNDTNWGNVIRARELCAPKRADSGKMKEGILLDKKT